MNHFKSLIGFGTCSGSPLCLLSPVLSKGRSMVNVMITLWFGDHINESIIPSLSQGIDCSYRSCSSTYNHYSLISIELLNFGLSRSWTFIPSIFWNLHNNLSILPLNLESLQSIVNWPLLFMSWFYWKCSIVKRTNQLVSNQ